MYAALWQYFRFRNNDNNEKEISLLSRQNDIPGLLNLFKTGQIYLKNIFLSETKGTIKKIN